MTFSIITLVLKFGLDLLPFFIKDKATRAKWEKRILKSLAKYEQEVEENADLREDAETAKDNARQKWKDRWGGKQ